MPQRKRTPEDFWARVDKSGDCWIWTGARNQFGYGNLNRLGRTLRAHRYAYELVVGPIPAGMQLMHSCDTPPCVNPAHLTPGTGPENIADRHAKGNSRGRARQDRCHRGHVYAEVGVRVSGTHRTCLACERVYLERRRERRRMAVSGAVR